MLTCYQVEKKSELHGLFVCESYKSQTQFFGWKTITVREHSFFCLSISYARKCQGIGQN